MTDKPTPSQEAQPSAEAMEAAITHLAARWYGGDRDIAARDAETTKLARTLDAFAARRVAEKDSEIAAILELRGALGFAATVIRSGEEWTATCEREIGDVLKRHRPAEPTVETCDCGASPVGTCARPCDAHPGETE